MSLPVKQAELKIVDQTRLEANCHLNPARKIALGQFMTSTSIAQFMASLFSERKGSIRLLDAGAGVGSLTDAFINRWGSQDVCLSAYEIDPTIVSYLRETLERYGNCGFESKIIELDLI